MADTKSLTTAEKLSLMHECYLKTISGTDDTISLKDMQWVRRYLIFMLAKVESGIEFKKLIELGKITYERD